MFVAFAFDYDGDGGGVEEGWDQQVEMREDEVQAQGRVEKALLFLENFKQEKTEHTKEKHAPMRKTRQEQNNNTGQKTQNTENITQNTEHRTEQRTQNNERRTHK